MNASESNMEESIKRLREELGAVRSCALIMAHAQAADVRTRYLKTLSEKVASMDSMLEKLLKESRPPG